MDASYYVLLNNDVEVTPGWLEPMLSLMRADTSIAACQPWLLDWKHRNRAHVVRATVSTVQPGDIVLMHDIHRTTVAAVPVILRQLTARGYHFVTVSQLMKGSPMRAGRVYLSNPALR